MMKRKKKCFCGMLVSALLATAMAVPAYAGHWDNTELGTVYIYDDGSGSYSHGFGTQKIDGREYFFGYNGELLKDTYLPDGRYAGADGAIVAGVTRQIGSDVRPYHAQYKQTTEWGNCYVTFWWYDEGGYSSDYRDDVGASGIMEYASDEEAFRYIIPLGNGCFALYGTDEWGGNSYTYMTVDYNGTNVDIQGGGYPYVYDIPLM